MYRTQRLVAGLAAAYKAAHPEEPAAERAPSAEEVEQSGIAALRAAIYGAPPTAPPKEEEPS